MIRILLKTVTNKSFGRREITSSKKIQSFGIKNKSGYITINGCDGAFAVNKQIVDALANYNLVNGEAFVLLFNDGSTGLRINETGPDAIKA